MSGFCSVYLLLFLKGIVAANRFANPSQLGNSTKLVFEIGKVCTYSYQVAIHTARGSHSTESQGHELKMLIDVTPVARQGNDSSLHINQLKVYQPRIRRLRGSHVVVRHPVNEELEKKLSNPFYFRQHDHGTVVDVLFPRNDEPRVIALKKGIAGAFQVHLNSVSVGYESLAPIEEHDDSGVYSTRYTTLLINDSHTTVRREWTNNDYLEFADGTPVGGEHKTKQKYLSTVHIIDGKIHKVHRQHLGIFESQKGHPRAENKKEYQEHHQDIQVSTTGYNKLKLVRCDDVRSKEGHHRSRRSAQTPDNLEKDIQGLHQENLVFRDSHKIDWKKVGGDKVKFRPFYELMRCFTDPTVKNREIAECSREMHKLAKHDKAAFNNICNLVLQRNLQNVTSWKVLVSVVAGRGGHRAQSVLAQALMSEYPRRLTRDEYETLLEGIFYIPKGPIHSELFNALFTQAARDSNHGHRSSMAMLVLAGLTKRAQIAGYNSTLSDVVAALIHDSYRNKSNVHDPDSVEHESYVRDHIWAFGNLGHLSGLEVMLKHAGHDSSGVRSAVVSSMRKLPAESTNKFLLDTLHNDEHNDVKAAVIGVFIERHEDLTDKTVQALEHAIWHAEDGDALDASVQEFLENHNNHPKTKHIRKRRSILRRQKRALIPALRPREIQLGPHRRWTKTFGGKYLGAESQIQFRNQVKLRIGIFGGNIEVNLDNYAKIEAHILKWGFDIVKGKAAFKASASFKNDIPKDLIHAIADAGDDILSKIDDITSIIFEQISKFKNKLKTNIPLNIQKLVDFVSKIVKFVQNLFKPLKPINLMKKILTFVKKVVERLKNWKWMLDNVQKIQITLNKLTLVNDLFRQVIAVLDRILDIVNRITIRLPHSLPSDFKIEDLLKWLKTASLDLQDMKIKEFFKSLGFSVPGGFKLQLPFRFTLHFSLSMEKFTAICMRLVNFANNFLDISSIFDVLKNLALPRLNLPRLEGKFPAISFKFFNFGLSFDWKINLNFKLNLKEPGFLKLINILGKLSDFFKQFKLPSFDLEKFFEDIMPGKDTDLINTIQELFGGNSNTTAVGKGPDDILEDFVNQILNFLNSSMPNITAISDITDFFQELGPVMKDFAEKSTKKICKVYKFALNSSKDFKDFGRNLEKEGIVILKKVDETTQGALQELMNYTIMVDGLIDELEKNFTVASRRFVSKSLQELSKSLKDIQLLADQVVVFANGTSSKVTGVCMKGADFSAGIIDKVQNASRDALAELTKFVGPVAKGIRTIGEDLKTTVTKVKDWYNENMAVRVGKISEIAQLLADFMSMLNTNKGFLGKVREIAIKVNNVLTHMRNLPLYANKARETADDIIQFADRAQSFKDEILKLDIRKEFGIDYDTKVRDLCNKFKAMVSQTLSKIGSYDVTAEVNKFFTVEADKLINKAVTKFRRIKEPIHEIQGELKEISSMVRQIMDVLINLKPFTSNFSPILSTINKLPDCQQTVNIFKESTKPCVRKAMIVGKYVIDQYKELRKETEILKDMIPETWRNFKTQKCIKGGACISKAFIDQAKGIKEKVDVLKDTFKEASGYTDMLETCKAGVENITKIIDTVKLLIQQVKDFDLRDDVQKVKDVLRRVTGRDVTEDSHGGRARRSIKGAKEKVKRVLDYIRKAKETKEKVEGILQNTFKAMKAVYNDAVVENVQKIQHVRNKLQTSYDLWKKTKDINTIIQALDTIIKEASDYANVMQGVTTKFSNPVVKLLMNTGELSDVIKPHMDKYIGKVKEVTDKVNGFFDKVTEFQNKIQLRQRGLDLSQFKEWSAYPYCSADVCVRSLRRSSSLYYSTIFTWKFPHLDDLSSMKDTGRWLIPGLFGDYKVEGITQLSQSLIILGMYGVSANKGKSSILVITTPGSSVRKIIQLGSPQSPFTEEIGGVSVARNSIWIASGTSDKIHRINKGSVTGSMSSSGPSWIGISKTYRVEGTATSVSFDEAKTMLWVTDGVAGKGYGYRLSPDGDLLSSNIAPDRVLVIREKAQGMAIVRQFNTEYVVVSRCAMRPGFQCKLEFHDLSGSDEVGENTLSRVVRTPSGLESVENVRNDLIAIVFSSATYSDRGNIENIGGDIEDRYFRMKLPILKMTFGITENCLYFKVMKDWIITPRRLIPFGDLRCGALRKRSIENELLESDVYSEELEEVHTRNKRATGEMPTCMTVFRGENIIRGYQAFMPDLKQTIIVFGIPISFFIGAGGHWSIDYQCQICMRDRTFKVGLIHGAWISVYGGASVSLLIVEAGITIEAILLETYHIPELTVKVNKWPLKACIELKQSMTPLKIRVWLWYRFISIRFRCSGWLRCSLKIGWGSKKTFAEWWWSTRKIERTLFSTCKKDVDRTPPIAGTCSARQVGEKMYFIQWHGFKEDTSINHYWVKIGSIVGSGDDYGANVGTSLSTIVRNLPIMHGRDVYVSVRATNDMGMDSRLALCPFFRAKRRGPQIRYVNDGSELGQEKDYQSDDYELAMNFAWAKGAQSILDVKWGISTSSKCTLDEKEVDVYGLMPVGETNTIQTSGLSLKHGQKYYTRVVATNSIGLRAVMCSDGIVIDTTPPVAGYLYDGSGEQDADFLPSTKRVRAKYQAFVDNESPLAKYEWKIVLYENFLDITPFVSIPLPQRTPLMEGLNLSPGQKYKIVLRGTNAAGLQTSVESNGFVPDNTAPICNVPFDVLSESDDQDVDFVRELKSIQAKWKCSDSESGIKKQFLAVGTYPGGDDIKSFDTAEKYNATFLEDGNNFVQLDGFDIEPRVRYHVTVKVFNGAGIRRTVSSDGILIDKTPPVVAPQFIKDGLEGKDQNYTKERFTFSVHWEQAFIDAESGLSEYRVGLGTKPGHTNTKNLIYVGKRNDATLTGLLLESGRKYFATVVGCNGVQMCVNASSNGAIVDYVPPHTGNVITGYQGEPVFFQWNTKSVWARWNWCPADEVRTSTFLDNRKCSNDSFYDVHSGIDSFSLSVTSLVNEKLLAEVKKVGRVRMSARSVELEDGIYSAVVQATDRAGMNSNGYSNTFIVDSSPPEVLIIQHGHRGNVMKYTREKDLTFKSYFEIEDDLTKIVSYKVAIGSYSGADDVASSNTIVLPQPQYSIAVNWTAEGPIKLQNNRKYYVTVQAFNSAGLTGIGSSDALLSDSEAPRITVVMDGWGIMDAKYQSYASIYRAHWHGVSDFSGIHSIYLGLKSTYSSSACDVIPLELVPNKANSHILSGLSLRSGSKYFACIKVVDNAQNEALFSSDGVIIDSTPPRAGTVVDGKSGQDIDVQFEGSILWASWSNFTEQETQIVGYKLAFGTAPGKVDIQEFTDVELVERAASTRMKVSELQSGQRYYATVVAVNNLGIPSAKVSSNGVLVDFTPPEFIRPVTDGGITGKDVAYTNQQTLSCSWICDDQETRLQSVEVAFGLQPGVTNVKNFTRVPNNQRKYVFSTNLRPGIKYFAMVRCTNRIGLTSISTSNGVAYDNSPPVAQFIDDGDYHNSTNRIDLKWKFYDVESGIKKYQVFVHLADNSSRQGPFAFLGAVTSTTVNLDSPLAVGKKYFVTVTAFNGADLTASITSDGFKVDDTPPLCEKVWDGDKPSNADLRFVGKTNRLTVSWNCSDSESPLIKIQFSVQEVNSQAVILPFHSLKQKLNSSGTSIITGNGRWNPRYLEGKTYRVGIELTNAVKLSSLYWTNGVMVDASPPVLKDLSLSFKPINDELSASWNVKDEESGVDKVQWGLGSSPEKTNILNLTFMDRAINSLTVSGSQIRLQLGRTYFLTLVATNLAGLASRTVSNGVVIDRTRPEAGVVTAQYVLPLHYDRNKNIVPGSLFTVSWTGFVDKESGVSRYSWAAGNNLQSLLGLDDSKYTNILLDESVGGVQIKNVTLVGNSTYYVCIRATNGAGLQRTDCSPGMKVVLGKFSAGVVNDGPRNSKKDLDFQLDDRALWAYWSGFLDPVYGVSSYEWCVGDHQPSQSESNVCKWPYMKVPLLRNHAHRFYNLTLTHGTTYYATVKAINSRGETVLATSDGVLVDRTSPAGGSINVSPSIGKDTQYITSLSAPTVTWEMKDNESGLSHFRIGIGSFPFQDDLLDFRKIKALERSVDLDEFNFTVNHGLSYFVAITGVNMLGLESSLITQQVVVDTTPPSVGVVVDGNRTSENKDLDYQTNNQALSAYWYGFEDDESDIVDYKWCIGLQQGTCSLKDFSSYGLSTIGAIWSNLREGERYYFTVQAINAAGLIQTASSDGVTIDISAPTIRRVTLSSPSDDISLVKLGNVTAQSSGRVLKVTWDKVTDTESGISSLMYCVGRTINECDIIDWTNLDVETNFFVQHFEKPLAAGTVIYITLQATNRAGLSVNATTDALLVDSSPPSVGSVNVGNVPDTKYLKEEEAVEAAWSGFEDSETGLDHFEWAVCPEMSEQKCVTPLVNIGLTTRIKNYQLQLKSGVAYVLVVQAYNKVGLRCEAQSNAFVLENKHPVPRSVFDGYYYGNDISIQSSVNTLAANWEHFIDYNSRITSYEICAGSKPLTCDINPYQDVGMTLKGELTGLSLAHMKTYYITVRATNKAGYKATGSTNGVKIDSTPPVGGMIRDGIGEEDIDYQAEDSFISANWGQFTDTESGIEKYIWCVGTSKGSCDVIPETEIPESTQRVARQINLPLSPGVTIYTKLKAINIARGETTVYSDGVTIDNTPPQLTEVKDLQTNNTLQDKNFITSKVDYCAFWNVREYESKIRLSKVSVCTDLNNNDCLATSIDVGNKSLVCLSNLKLAEGVKYVTIVRVTNSVGLSTTSVSDGFLLDPTPPVTGEISHITNGSNSLESFGRNFTSKDIPVRLSGFCDKESSVSKYYICLGKYSGGCNVVNFTDIGNHTEYTFTGIRLEHNTMYYVSVIAENEARLRSDIASSDGVLMDATAPLTSGMLNDGDTVGKDINFQQSTTDIKAHWTSIEDPESDVVKVTWCAGSARGVCDIVPMKTISPSIHNVHTILDSPMRNGQKFFVSVRATNSAGKTTTLSSDGVTVDNTPPESGVVVDGNSSKDISCLYGDDDVQANWSGFADKESGIERYEVAVCEARNLNDCPQPYTTVYNTTQVRFTGLDLESGAMYIVFVKAISFAGLQTVSTSNGFTVDFSPPKEKEAWLGPGRNNQLHFQSSDNQLHVRWSPFEDLESGIVKYEICASLSSIECNKTNFVNIGQTTSYVLSGLKLDHGRSYHVTIKGTNGVGLSATVTTKPILIDTTPPKVIDEVQDQNTSDIRPTAAANGFNNNSVPKDLLQSPSSSPTSYIRFTCTEELLSVEWDEFDDPESGMSKYEWCVGTRYGICDVFPLTSVVLNLSGKTITTRISSGTELFATVNVVNNVGLKTVLNSKRCLVMTVAPKVVDVLDLEVSNTSNPTDVDWMANMKSLTLKWSLIGKFLDDISRMRLEVAVTSTSRSRSLPRLNKREGWNGEPFAQDFMNVHGSQRNVTVESVQLQPWIQYRGVVRVWNEGGIYDETSSDGVRVEPSPPLSRQLFIRDNSPENERARWLPNLHLPPINKSALDKEVIYISSPSEILVAVSTGINATNSSQLALEADLLESDHFSPTQEFKALVTRVTSDSNETNTTENSLEMKTLPGFSNPQGPCCANYTPDSPNMLTDNHYKPTLPTQKFGSSVALLPHDYITVASSDKFFIFSVKNRTLKKEVIKMTSATALSYSEDWFVLASIGMIKVYRYGFSEKGDIELKLEATISSCKTNPCVSNETWPNLDGEKVVIQKTTIAATGRITSSNNSVIGIFRQMNGAWQLHQELGTAENDQYFGRDFAMNDGVLAVSTGGLALPKVVIYSMTDFSVIMKIDLKHSSINMVEPSLRLTKQNELVMVSKVKAKSVVIKLNIPSISFNLLCTYVPPIEIQSRLSGKFELMDQDGGTIVALGMQTSQGRDGVILIAFNGVFAYGPDHDLGKCTGLGTILSSENHSRVDDGIPRASVAMYGSNIVFGTPGILTWPDVGENYGTGRVYTIKYCPRNYKRIKISKVNGGIESYQCQACEEGRRSLGGITSICTVCEGRKCVPSLVDDPVHFTTKMCDNQLCPLNEQIINKTNGIKIIQMNGTFFEEGAANEYTVKLVETTRAGMSTTSESEPFIIDTTSPVVGTVYDGLGSNKNMNCSSNETFGEDSQCSTRSFQDTDIDYTNNTSEVHARWIDFADNESDIAEYFWCVGSKPMLDDIRQCESTGQRQNGSHYGLDFQQGDTYYVTVVACNGAQRCSAGHSNGVEIDVTPPTMQYVRDGVFGPDMDYQIFLDIIFAYFKASDENSGINSYEVAWGTAPGLTDMKEYEEVVNTTIWYAKFKDNTLEKKKKYFATVRASNKAGLLSEPMSSDGIIVGKSEYIFDKNASASFFFDTVNVKIDGTREDGGVGKIYGTLEVPKGAVDGEVKLQCYTLDSEIFASNKSEHGPVSNPSITKPKQFMLGNYSFLIKAVAPLNNTVQEGYKFAKPITISMFYDVDKLVRANKRVVNKEVKKEDVDPVLYLWNIKNNTWIDASLSCPEPWKYINRTIKLLAVHICHLTQFAFFWSFKAQNGLMMFEKNTSVYDTNGDVIVFLETRARQIDLPIKRSKGSTGNIEVYWSLQSNESLDSNLIWPKSGKISLTESQWNATLSLMVASNERRTGKQVIYVRLDNVTGGAILASRDKIESTLIIVGSSEVHQDPKSTLTWIIGVVLGVFFIAIVILGLVKRSRRNLNTVASTEVRELEYINLGDVGNMQSNSNADQQHHSKEKEVALSHQGGYNNPSFENNSDVAEIEMGPEDQYTVLDGANLPDSSEA